MPMKKTANSERAELIGYFTDMVNSYRKGTKYKPLSYKAIAVKLSHLTVGDLYYLKSSGRDAKNWSAYFWWSIKPEKLSTQSTLQIPLTNKKGGI